MYLRNLTYRLTTLQMHASANSQVTLCIYCARVVLVRGAPLEGCDLDLKPSGGDGTLPSLTSY
jgi:hypothetical protein